MRSAKPAHFGHCVTGADYVAPWDRLITAFKFHQQVELAGALSQAIERAVLASAPHARSGGSDRPLLLPVPLSRERLRERGYNQAGSWRAGSVAGWAFAPRRTCCSAAATPRIRSA